MKKLIFLILSWYAFTNFSEKSDWWIELITDTDGTVTKVKRSDYLELIEQCVIIEEKIDQDWYKRGELVKHLTEIESLTKN